MRRSTPNPRVDTSGSVLTNRARDKPTPSSPTSLSNPAAVPSNTTKQIDSAVDSQVHYEFGGPLGVTFMMFFFPVLMYYLYYCLVLNSGRLSFPPLDITKSPNTNLDITMAWARNVAAKTWANAKPDRYAVTVYTIFCVFQAWLAVNMPGPVVKGLPVPSLGFRQLEYVCNGVASWYATLAVSAILHITGIFPLSSIINHIGPLMSVSIIYGFAITILTYLYGVLTNNTHRMSGNILYDIFMGAVLNPRLFNGKLDLKMWAEIRVPWVILFYISVSAAAKEYELRGSVRPEVLFMVLAHFLYVNACMKGEECIPTTWDIFYEKWGFMLIFWNMSGVPFTYCYSSLYLLETLSGRSLTHSTPYLITLYTTLLVSYYIWDTANSQKNRFRQQQSGTFIARNTFPQLPWGTLKNPSFIRTKHGSLLLTSGWWGIARKIHYTADLGMAFSWAFITVSETSGVGSVIPFFYPCFFVIVLVHRVTRDMERCKKKYGADWDDYCKRVPWIFVPYVY
ncbi:C-24(28) sterol reductase [Quaeritorhiza haematococci]|nr:C-24(28) sterol reductase [Quaeritorhiza haematococci]